jgi:hypothetical protein
MIDAPSRPGVISAGSHLLRYAALAYGVGFLLHTADHLRRGIEAVTPQVLWMGNVASVIAIAAIALAIAGYRVAPAIAAVHGFTQAIGVAAVHLLPAWGAFSDSLPDGGADVLSWAAVLAEIVGALAFGVAGATLLRRSVNRRRTETSDTLTVGR